MPSTFLGLNTGMSGLTYFQGALNTTAHNISNANTEGYSRQQVLASASDALSLKRSDGMMGTGVTSGNIDRLRNNFYDNKYWAANNRYSKYNTQADNLSQLQTYMNEISDDSGYSKWISLMSSSIQDVADNPSNNTTRISYTLTADSYTDMINELSNNFQITQKTINDEVELAVSEINSLSRQIYELTQQIMSIELKGANANDLRDKRGVCIDKLSEYANIEVQERSIMYGVGTEQVKSSAEALSIRMDGCILVDEMEYNELMVVPRTERVNQSDVEGLVDIYWQNADGTPGEKFNSTKTEGRICGLFDIRDGNNGETLSGTIKKAGGNPPSVTIEADQSININKINIPSQGSIRLNGREYLYDGWKADYDEDGNLNNFVFENMTMLNEKRVEVTAAFPDQMIGFSGVIGEKNQVKGIPYYMARLNEMVRTFSKYMNDLTTSGVDANGEDGLDMYTAKDVYGNDFVLKGTMQGTGTISSSDQSYYRLTALNWELNSQWKTDPNKVVVSYKKDIEQGDIEARPILDKMIFGMTDPTMFEQGTLSQYMQSITTNMAVDIAKVTNFAANQDDIRYTIDNQRTSVSGVDENEEASDLVKFQNLYGLASKVISVLNEVYDKLINQTGV